MTRTGALNQHQTDVLIIGGGPAGLTAGLYSARAGVETLVLAGTQGSRLSLDYRLENYPGFIAIESGDLLKRFREHALHYGASILDEDSVEINLADHPKWVSTRSRVIEARSVIIASGRPSGKDRSIPGEKERLGMGVSYCPVCDGAFFRGRRVLVAGNSEEASEDIEALLQMGVNVCWATGDKQDFQASSDRLEKLRAAGVTMRAQSVVHSIQGERQVESVVLETDGQLEELLVDGVFIVRPTPFEALFDRSGLKFDHRRCVDTDRSLKTNLDGVFVAGDIACGGMQVVTAAGEGAAAALQALKYLRTV